MNQLNLSQLCRQLLLLHQQVRDCKVQALPSNSLDQVTAIKRQEGLARQERKRLCGLIKQECKLRVTAWDNGWAYSQVESTKRFTARRGSRGR